jgi:hypothetical protein
MRMDARAGSHRVWRSRNGATADDGSGEKVYWGRRHEHEVAMEDMLDKEGGSDAHPHDRASVRQCWHGGLTVFGGGENSAWSLASDGGLYSTEDE